MKKKRILVTNDDGIHARGIRSLVEAVKDLGEVIVVAPDKGNSAKSHSVTFMQPVYYHRAENIDGSPVYGVSGTPVDSVKMAMGNILESKPDLILSGINHGSNATINVLYSGTMAAAIEGATFNIPSAGFSLDDHSPNANFDAAKKYVRKLVLSMINNPMPDQTCLNVNIPAVPENEIKGIEVCRQTRGYWNEGFTERTHPAGFSYYWLSGKFENCEPDEPGTDEWALRNNYVAVVPVKPDFTNYAFLKELKQWNYDQ